MIEIVLLHPLSEETIKSETREMFESPFLWRTISEELLDAAA